MKKVGARASGVAPGRNMVRSFSIPSELAAEAKRVVPPDVAANLNQMVTVALRELVERVKRERFAREMDRMGEDPALRKESAAVSREFRDADADGLA